MRGALAQVRAAGRGIFRVRYATRVSRACPDGNK